MDINPYSGNKPSFAEQKEKLLARLNKDPKDIEAAIELGDGYFDHNEPTQAILYYNIALLLNPDIPTARTDMGTMYWRNGNVSFAEQAFRDALKSDPDFPNAKLNLGMLLLHEKGNQQEAHTLFREVADAFPDQPAGQKAKELLQG
jgi:Flp pilus assembly protein TadD